MSTTRKLTLAALWIVTLVIAFLGGTLVPRGADEPAASASASAQSPAATVTPGGDAASASAQASADAEVVQFLLQLPRREEGDARALGALDAPVVLTNWSDYRCPYCARWHEETFPQLQSYVEDGTLRIEFRDLVLFGEQSQATAVAARAAGLQGRFWEFQEAVFAAAPASGHPDIDRDALLAFAETAGVEDLAAFETALDDADLLAAVQADTTQAQGWGISGTPFFVVGGQTINGAQPLEVFTAAIEAEAAR